MKLSKRILGYLLTVSLVLIGVAVPLGIFVWNMLVNRRILMHIVVSHHLCNLAAACVVLAVSTVLIPVTVGIAYKLRFFSLLDTMSSVAYAWRG